MKPRHPEKIKNSPSPLKKKPEWIRSKLVNSQIFFKTKEVVNRNKLNTVCQEANCPNITECWSKKHATFMIMGDTCTRGCAFCDVKTGKPSLLDPFESIKVSKAVQELELNHVVITSVDRDDLDDGGANHFKEVVLEVKKNNPNTTVEVLTPDFLKKGNSYEKVLEASPDVFNHNIETVSRLYKTIRPGAIYKESLNLLKSVKSYNSDIFTKSGLMVGLGETLEDIQKLLMDLRDHKVDFVTIGQYLQPSIHHEKVHKFYTPDEFKFLYDQCVEIGFKMVSSSPLTRSSYHADEDFIKLKKAI